MTSSRMENPLWKKLQNDPSLLKFQQQLSNNNTEANNNLLSVNELNRNSNILGMNELILDNNNSTNELNSLQSLILNSNNNNNNNSMMPHSMPSQLSPDSLGLLKQHQMQPTTSSYASLIEHQNQQLQQLQQFINNSQKISTPDVQPSVATSAQYFTDNTELNLNQLLMVNEMNSLGDPFQNDNGNYPSFNMNSIKKQQQQHHQQQQQQHLMSRERGIIEKIVGSYGFVKCLDRDGRLFFHYSSFQNNDNNNTELTTSLKVGDFVEFEEGVDKRNGKPIAINLNRLDIKTSTTNSMKSSNQHEQLSSIDSSLNLMNLKELLLKNGSASGVGGGSTTNENLLLLHQQQQHQNYQAIMNGLKVLNMQNLATNNNNNNSEDTTANNLNSIMNLFNKENIFNNTNNNNNNLNQMNINTNILNMAKAAATTSSTTTSSVSSSLSNGNDNLANLVKMFNVNTNINNNNNNTNLDMKQQQKNDEQMEGTVAIVATKRPSPSVSSSSILLAQQLDGRITYQRSGETFYIPYSLSDVVNTNVQLRIGDRVKFYIAHLLNNSSNNNLLQQQQHLPVVTTYYARKVEVISHDYNLSINELAQHLLLAQQQQQQFQQQQAKQVYRGIITTLKDSFGKIEHEDQFKETFFHFSEYRGPNANQELRLGLNVEFELQDRHGKEIACNIRMLTQQGTLTFDELSTQVYIGRIIQPLTKITNATNLNGINLVSLSGTNFSSIGRLIYDSNTSNNNNNSNMNNNGESLVELSFTDRDRCDGAGEYTWLEGDFVQFRIASDKRRKTCKPQQLQLGLYQRATQMTLIEEHSLVENSINTNEHRERGVLVKLYNSKDLLPAAVAAALMENDINVNNNINKYGAIQCLEQNDLVYFSLSEVISYVRFSTTSKTTTNYSVNEVKLQVGDSLEFSVVKCQKDFIFKNGLKAIRLRQLAKNSVQFEVVSTETYNGLIEREAINSNNTTDNSSLTGLIRLDYKNGTSSNKNNNSASQTINFNYSDEQCFNIGDKVKFNICTCLKTKKQTAVDLKLVEAFKEQGIITTIVSKDSIGSIELLSLNKNNNNKQQKIIPREILFKANSLASVCFSDLNIGDHVEFNVNKKNLQNIFAENLTKIATKKSNFKIFSNLSTTVHKGRVTHQLKPHKSSNTVNISNLDEKKTQQQLDDDYFGKIQIVTSSNERKESVGSVNDSSSYQFGLFSLNDKKFLLQVGDLVSFQLGTCFDGTKKAANIQYIAENQQQQSNQSRQRNNNNNTNEFKKGKIDSIKGHCGFIEYTTNNDDRKKIFFHISDLTDENGNGSESSNVKIGDEVEFILMHNSRSGKYSAVKIKRLASKTTSNSDNSQVTSVNNNNGSADQLNETAKRPERLITKLKLANIDDKSGKQLILIRQPNNPDSKAKSFSRQLSERLAGSLEPLLVARQRKSEESSDSSDKETVDEPADHQQQQQQIPSTMSIIDLLMANSSN